MLKRLMLAHEAWFDVYTDHEFAGRTFPGYAEFHTHGEQYVLVKRAKLWEVDSHEYLFFWTCERLGEEEARELIGFMKAEAPAKVTPDANHMSSNLSLIVVADAVDDEAARLIRTTRHRKNFKLGFRGWADVRLAAADLSAQKVYTNPAGKQLRGVIEANMGIQPEVMSKEA